MKLIKDEYRDILMDILYNNTITSMEISSLLLCFYAFLVAFFFFVFLFFLNIEMLLSSATPFGYPGNYVQISLSY